MVHRIRNNSEFYPVGQGLFYSSQFYYENRDNGKTIECNIIFDCGSENLEQINKSIDQYFDRYNRKVIDVLIISHLHFDHISGLDKILNDTSIKIKTIVLPYLYPEERILLAVDNSKLDDWYYRFLSNPLGYLSEYDNIGNIITIASDNDNDTIHSIPEGQFFNDENINPDSILINRLTGNAFLSDFVNANENIQNSKKISFAQDKGYLIIGNFLYLSFFNYSVSKSKLDEFKGKIIDFGILTPLSFKEIIKSKKKLDFLKKAYEVFGKDLNISSLAMFQGIINPLKNKNPQDYYFDCYCRHHRYWHYHDAFCDNCCDFPYHCEKKQIICGKILLGDIKLNYKLKSKSLFEQFEKLLPSVMQIQISHHGADCGWNDELINQFSKKTKYIVSYGIENKYSHPHKNVIMQVVNSGRNLHCVNENKRYVSECGIDWGLRKK